MLWAGCVYPPIGARSESGVRGGAGVLLARVASRPGRTWERRDATSGPATGIEGRPWSAPAGARLRGVPKCCQVSPSVVPEFATTAHPGRALTRAVPGPTHTRQLTRLEARRRRRHARVRRRCRVRGGDAAGEEGSGQDVQKRCVGRLTPDTGTLSI